MVRNSRRIRYECFAISKCKKKKPHLVRQSSCVVRDKMKVCLEEIQVTVMYILWREVKSENVTV